MNTTQTGTWQLKGITVARANCDHCGRNLSRCFRVASPAGEEMVVGRNCAKNLTGWSWSVAQAERAEARRLREVAAAASFGDLWVRVVEAAWNEPKPMGVGGRAGEAMLMLRDNPQPRMTNADRAAWAEAALAGKSLANA